MKIVNYKIYVVQYEYRYMKLYLYATYNDIHVAQQEAVWLNEHQVRIYKITTKNKKNEYNETTKQKVKKELIYITGDSLKDVDIDESVLNE